MIVRAELEHLYTICYYQQRRAIMCNKPQSIEFDCKNNSYTANEHRYKLPFHVQFGVPSGVQGPPSSPHALIHHPITFKNNTVTFHADGVIQPGALYLTDTSKRCCYALSCSVAQVSYLRKYRYNNGWHLIS
jgi:hypothetical protein